MKNWSIRTRVLFLALAPSVMILLALVTYFTYTSIAEVDIFTGTPRNFGRAAACAWHRIRAVRRRSRSAATLDRRGCSRERRRKGNDNGRTWAGACPERPGRAIEDRGIGLVHPGSDGIASSRGGFPRADARHHRAGQDRRNHRGDVTLGRACRAAPAVADRTCSRPRVLAGCGRAGFRHRQQRRPPDPATC